MAVLGEEDMTLSSHVSDLQQFLPPRMLGAALKGSGPTAQVVHGYCPFCCPLNAEDIGRQEHGFNIQSWGRVSYREDGRSWINGVGVDGELGRRTLQLKCPDQKYRWQTRDMKAEGRGIVGVVMARLLTQWALLDLWLCFKNCSNIYKG